ncbi:MAG: hypothetical protein MST01_07820, partial [Prevotella sp.]|nr:hypothetical protein [Prevotella sp.]
MRLKTFIGFLQYTLHSGIDLRFIPNSCFSGGENGAHFARTLADVVSVSTMTYCVVQINFLPLPRFLKEVTMKTAEERYEETWNSYLELL